MADTTVSKRCPQCKLTKIREEFYVQNCRADGMSQWCKECTKRKMKEYLEKRKSTPEGFESYRQMRKTSLSKMSEEQKEKKKQSIKRWGRENKEKLLAQASKRRARIHGNGGSHTAEEWRQLKALFGGRCVQCGSSERLSRDHVWPIVEGGTDNIENIQPLCLKHNFEKGQAIIDYRIRSKVVLKELNAVGKWIYEGDRTEFSELRVRRTVSGALGVSLFSKSKTPGTKWRARLMVDGKDRTIGYFATKEEAIAARSLAVSESLSSRSCRGLVERKEKLDEGLASPASEYHIATII